MASEAYRSDEQLLRLLRFTIARCRIAGEEGDFVRWRGWKRLGDRALAEIHWRGNHLPPAFLADFLEA